MLPTKEKTKSDIMASQKVCKSCKRVVKGNVCEICKRNEFTRNWKGVVQVLDTDSEVARTLEITVPGKYALRIK